MSALPADCVEREYNLRGGVSRSPAVVRALGGRQRGRARSASRRAWTCAMARAASKRSICFPSAHRRAARCCSSTAATGARWTRATIPSWRRRWSTQGIGGGGHQLRSVPAGEHRAHRRAVPGSGGVAAPGRSAPRRAGRNAWSSPATPRAATWRRCSLAHRLARARLARRHRRRGWRSAACSTWSRCCRSRSTRDLRLDATQARAMSPIHLRPHACRCRCLIAVGADETSEFIRQSRLLWERWPESRSGAGRARCYRARATISACSAIWATRTVR